MVPSLTPYDLPFPPKWGFHMPQTYANGHISATGDPIHFMFGSRVRFSGTADLMALSSIRINSRWRPPPSWKNFKWRYLRNRSSDPLHVWLGWVFGDGGSNGAIFDSNKFNMAAATILEKFRIAISPQRLTIYLYSAHRAVIFAIAQLSCSQSDQVTSVSIIGTIY